MAEERIKELISRFLTNQPHGSEMTPDKSIYDLARVVFAGNSVMLKEHFRCVPAIIEFSNREFYKNDIRPLRVPKANERLDPPLVDVFVKGGHRNGDVNAGEAKVCIPHNLDTDYTANWTLIPRESGQSERSDAGLKGFTLSLVLRSSFWSAKASVWRYCVTDSLSNRRRFS